MRRFGTASRVLAASYGQLALRPQAHAALVDMLENNEIERTIADVIRPFMRPADRAHDADGLRKAGLPEATGKPAPFSEAGVAVMAVSSPYLSSSELACLDRTAAVACLRHASVQRPM
jgi:hypothetical protein